MDDKQIVGMLNKKVIGILGLSWKEGSVIICGEANRNHMRVKHPEVFKQYGDKLIEIIGHPIARTLFIMTEEKVLKYKKKNALKPYDMSTKIIL